MLDIRPFNPILVWFQRFDSTIIILLYSILSIPFWSDFNSPIAEKPGVYTPYFQSHFGLISTLHSSSQLHKYYTSFNPILVWFQQHYLCPVYCCVIGLSIPFWSDFNSHLTLKSSVNEQKLSIPFWSDFNTPLTAFPEITGISIFQSHFGLISTSNRGLAERPYPLPFNPILVWFQQCIQKNMERCTCSLSIPFWSDFN